jgi:hypothetical protein
MNQPLTRSAPKRNGCLRWGRFQMGDTGVVAYRLFRRDLVGTLHFEALNFYRKDSRREITLAVRTACNRLSDHADKLDHSALGVLAWLYQLRGRTDWTSSSARSACLRR